MRIISPARLKSLEVSLPRSGVSSRSCGVSIARLRPTFCSVRMAIICSVSPTTDCSDSRPDSGVAMSTTITTSTPIARATSTGRLSTSPPSPRMWPSTSVGANTPGTLMLERSATARSPCERITGLPVSMSVATARNGIGRRSKSSMWRAGSVSRRSSSSSPRLDSAPCGALSWPSCTPNSSPVAISKSSSLRRCDR